MDDLFSKKDSLPTKEILEYLIAGKHLEDNNSQEEVEEFIEYVKTDGFNSLPEDIKGKLVEFLDELTVQERVVVQLYLGIPFDPKIFPENLLEEDDKKFSNEDIKKLLSMYRKSLN